LEILYFKEDRKYAMHAKQKIKPEITKKTKKQTNRREGKRRIK